MNSVKYNYYLCNVKICVIHLYYFILSLRFVVKSHIFYITQNEFHLLKMIIMDSQWYSSGVF